MIIFSCVLLASCSGTRNLPKDEKLYTGAEIKLETSEKVSKRYVKNVAKKALRPEPNKSILGMRPRLWLHMAAREHPHTLLGKWLKKNGEAPIFVDDVNQTVTANVIDARLFNIGIFKSYTTSKIVEKKRTAKVIYTSNIHKPYIISEITHTIYDDSISKKILAEEKKSLIKPGVEYNLDLLKSERIRIDEILKNQGYFYFNPDYLIFQADTSAIDQTIILKMSLKDSIPSNALKVYHIHNVFINQNFSLNEDVSSNADTIHYQNNVFAGKKDNMNIRPKVILESVYLKNGEIYSRQNHSITLNRLMSMGNFKFVQVKFADSDTTAAGYLDVTILMTTMTNRTFRAELDLVSKSNNFMGPRMNVGFVNRNTFRGAEMLNLNMAGSFEAQLIGNGENLYSYSWNPQIELVFPRLIAPIKIKKSQSIYIPKTRFLISYNFLKRVNYFDMNTFQFIYGYKWKQNLLNEHEFNPVKVSYTSIKNKSATFNEMLNSNSFLKKSYEEMFIAGGNYSFTYNEQLVPLKKIQYFFLSTAETAGNLFSIVNLIRDNKPTPENPSTLIGSVYSQYAKLSVDGRLYYNFRNKNRLVGRLFAGYGKPYLNSLVLPYSKQFFSGGPNSLRAFQINSVGPGTYYQNRDSLGYFQLGGDIQLEMNAEYRFGVYRFLKGAIFVDAGNVWLQKSNPEYPDNYFKLSRFMNELAVGAGVGFRIDVSFFILRFDLATPLRKPWLTNENEWVTNKINFTNSAWRKDNLVLNIAIGYPF